jgi:hypothetical protein
MVNAFAAQASQKLGYNVFVMAPKLAHFATDAPKNQIQDG